MLRNRYAFPDLMDKARAVLDAVGLRKEEDELAVNLSHGAQRNLEIGIALATEPQILCLDEPTAGMSVTETHATVELVRRIARNLTIVIVEHDMEVVMGLAHTITVLHYGEVLAEGTPSDIQANPRVQEVYLKT
jgi:branched-chain amino acid transport system ATP-binding protein